MFIWRNGNSSVCNASSIYLFSYLLFLNLFVNEVVCFDFRHQVKFFLAFVNVHVYVVTLSAFFSCVSNYCFALIGSFIAVNWSNFINAVLFFFNIFNFQAIVLEEGPVFTNSNSWTVSVVVWAVSRRKFATWWGDALDSVVHFALGVYVEVSLCHLLI